MTFPDSTTTMDRPVNLLRATATCNSFYIFLSAAKAALLPFLTLFFRLIGLSALETGIVMAAKTLTGFLWAPLWAQCAVAYNKRRSVLIFSLFMMGIMYMSFTAVYYKVGNMQTCEAFNDSKQEGNGTTSPARTTNSSLINNDAKAASSTFTTNTTTTPFTNAGADKESANTTNNLTDLNAQMHGPGELPTTATPSVDQKMPSSTAYRLDAAPLTTLQTTLSSENVAGNSISTDKNTVNKLNRRHIMSKERTNIKNILQSGLTAHQLYIFAQKNFSNITITEDEIQQLLDSNESLEETEPGSFKTKRSADRGARSLNVTFFNNLKDKVGMLAATLEEKKLLLFIVVLLVIIFGEFFSAPVEKIADDAWFDFLERIDDMERYGRQRYWGSLSFIFVPIVVTCLVDYTPCRMLLSLHHFLLHFYIFGIFLIFTIFIAFYFPMPPPIKQKYTSKIGKSLRVICCDARGLLFVVTLLVAGMVFAAFNNFLFWHLQDLGASELTLGLCISVGAFAETPMLVFSNKLVRKLGHGGLVSLSLLLLALRLLYYGFLWTPWAVLPAELTNAFTHTALWYAILSYDEFNIGSAMDRSIRSVLSSIYFGLGFSLGAFVSGLVYQELGASVLFWGASLLSGVWCLMFSVIQFCLPKKERVKYIKLLRKNDDESSEADDDWLELALKEQ